MRVGAPTAPLQKASTPITNDNAPTTAVWPLARISLQSGVSAKQLLLLADDPLALGYSWLFWLLHAVANAALACTSVPLFHAVCAIQLLNTIGTYAVCIIAATAQYSVFLLSNATAWSQWFRPMVASDLRGGAPFQRSRDLLQALTTPTVSNPDTFANLAFALSSLFDK